MSKDVVVLNHIGGGFDILLDRFPSPNETIMMKTMMLSEDLGKGGNIAVALSRLGVDTEIIGKIGKDEAGRRDYEWMEQAGVGLSELICEDDIVTGQGIGLIIDNGENIMITGESSSKFLTFSEVCEALERLSPIKYFISGFEVRPELVLSSIQYAHKQGIKTILNPSPVPVAGMEGPLPFVDYLFVNEVEAGQLLEQPITEETEPKLIIQELKERYQCPNIVMTFGDKGATCLAEDGFQQFAPIKVNAVDASGAGDGFLAAVVSGLLKGEKLVKACRWAVIYSAYSVTKRDTLPGYADVQTVNKFFENINKKGTVV